MWLRILIVTVVILVLIVVFALFALCLFAYDMASETLQPRRKL